MNGTTPHSRQSAFRGCSDEAETRNGWSAPLNDCRAGRGRSSGRLITDGAPSNCCRQ